MISQISLGQSLLVILSASSSADEGATVVQRNHFAQKPMIRQSDMFDTWRQFWHFLKA